MKYCKTACLTLFTCYGDLGNCKIVNRNLYCCYCILLLFTSCFKCSLVLMTSKLPTYPPPRHRPTGHCI